MSREGDDHLISLIGMMGSSSTAGDGEAINAFRVATRALERRGLSWRELAVMALRPPVAARPIWQGPAPSATPRPEPKPNPAPPPRPAPPPEPDRIRKRGFQVPPAISGTVRILDDDRKGRILIIEVEGRVQGQDVVYGPLLAYAGTVRDTLLASNNHYGTLRVRPPLHESSMPQVVSCSTVR